MKEPPRKPAASRQLFLELTEGIPDLQVRAAALMAATTGWRMAELLTGEALAPPPEVHRPIPEPGGRAEAFMDGVVNRRR